MKQRILLLVVAFISITVSICAQKVTLNFKQTKLSNVLKSITQQTGLTFTYSQPTVDPDRVVSIEISDTELSQALEQLFRGTDIGYEIDTKKVFLVKKSDSSSTNSPPKNKRKVTGTITDVNNDPVIGASVVEKGTQNGVITDLDGYFTMDVSPDAVLAISYVGFSPQEIRVGDRREFKITLDEDQKLLDEVVVIGYGIQRKKDVTSSVSSLRASELTQGAVGANPLQVAEGKVAGLVITRSNGNDPNAALDIQLRGVSSVNGEQKPLVIIDGVPGGDLATLTAQDIESIDILKDGSAAAIYGTRGTNGVILITTKKGAKGTTKVEFEAMLFTETIDKKLEVLSAQEYRQFATDRDIQIQDEGANTDWFDELTKTPLSQMYNLSLSGGSDYTTYRATLSFKDQKGITKTPTTRETINTRVSLSQKAWEGKLTFDFNVAYSNIKARLTDYSSPDYGAIQENASNYSAFEQALKRNPTEPVYNQDGTFFYPQGGYEFDFNPVARLQNTINRLESNRVMGDARISLDIIQNLRTSIMFAIRKQSDNYSLYDSRLSEASEKSGILGQAERITDNYTDRTLEWTADYNKTIDKHFFSIMAGYSYQDFVKDRFYARNMGFITDAFGTDNLADGTYLRAGLANMGSAKQSNTLIAFFGRATYNFDNRYLLTATMRREGSSRFGDNHKWGNFPAISLGWRASSESFMQNMEWLTDLKVRGGFGVTGNQMSQNYISIPRMSGQQSILQGDKWVQGYGLSSNPNPDLKWETKEELNIGFDITTLDNRLGMTFDLYQRKQKDLLYQVQAPVPALVQPTMWANVGNMKSNGIELVIFGIPVKTKDFTMNASMNFSYNKSKMQSMSNDKYVSAATYIDLESFPAPGNLGSIIRLEENEEVGNFYGYKFLGFTDDGKWIFDDVDDSGTYNDKDRQIIGNGVPKYFAGLTAGMSYKRFDLSLTFRGAFDFDILNMKEIYYANPSIFPANNLMKSALGKHKDINDIPQYSSYYLEKGDYVKLGNVTFAYRVNTQKFSKYVSSLRLYVTGDNLLTITGYDGVNPELRSTGLITGIDYRTYYPRTRTFTFGVNIGF